MTARHVDLVEGRQHGGGVLRVLEAARDGLAQPRHLHALLARGIVGGRRRARLHGGGGLAPASARTRRRSIAASTSPLVTRPSLPVPATVGGVDAALGGDACAPTAPAARPAAAPWRRLRRQRRRCGGLRRGCGLGGRGGRRRGGGAFGSIWPSSAPTRDGLAVLGDDLAEHAGGRRRHLDGDLVGLELDQRLVGLTASPGFLNHWPWWPRSRIRRGSERGFRSWSCSLFVSPVWRSVPVDREGGMDAARSRDDASMR